MVDQRTQHEQVGWPACCCFLLLLLCCTIAVLTVIFVPIFLFASYSTVSVAVVDASLGRLVLAAAPGNGTAPFLSYNLSLAVAVRNPNWAIGARRAAPLDAELRFRGRPFATVRLAGAAERGRIRALTTVVYRVAAAADRAPVELGSDRVAEFDRERVAGEFHLGLIVAGGEFKYQANKGRHSVRVKCPLKLSLSTSTAAAPAAFARVKCTKACEDEDG